MKGENMFRFKCLFRFLAVWFGIIAILSISQVAVSASEKPEIFVQLGHRNPIHGLVFSDNGRHIISVGLAEVLMWDMSSGRQLKSFSMDDDISLAGIRKSTQLRTFFDIISSNLNSISSPDNKYFVYVNENPISFTLADKISGKPLKEFKGDSLMLKKASFANDGKYFYSYGPAVGGAHIYKWNKDGVLSNSENGFILDDNQFILKYGQRFIKKLFIKKTERFVEIIDSKSGKQIEINNPDFVEKVRGWGFQLSSITPQMDRMLVHKGEEIDVIDIKSFTKVNTLKTDLPGFIGFDRQSSKCAWSNGSNVAVIGELIYKEKRHNAVLVFDINSGKQVFTKIFPDIKDVAFSIDGKSIFIASMYNVTMLNIESGDITKIINTEKNGKKIINPLIISISVSNDGKYVAVGDRSGAIHIWNLSNWEKIGIMKDHLAIESISFSPDSKNIISVSEGSVKIWDISTGKEITQFISFTDGEWVVITPEGYFNASPGGAKHLNVRVGNQVYSIDNFYEKFFNPVYVASVLQGKKVEAVADIRKGILTPPDVRITSPAPGSELATDTLTVTVTAKDTGGGIDEIRLYHNGKAINDDTRAVKIVSKGNEAIRKYTVSLLDGLNTFRAVGFSEDRTESNPYELIVKLTAPSKDVSLYVLAVGINQYKNPALNLNYAEPDARGIIDFFKRQGKELFKNVDIMEIYNEQATKVNIISKLSQLRNINPQDAVLIYLAGHGENINDKWYFIPHELTYPEREEDVKIKGISSDELSGYMKNIKAQKILLLIDACKAGAVLIAFRGFEDRKALSQLSRSTGVHIVAASTKDQFAAEVKELGHGVFTYTLLEGLGGKAAGAHEAVTVRKLMGYVEEKLPEITKKYKQESQYPVVDSRGMDFPLVIGK
jgi:WD40 repeat protein